MENWTNHTGIIIILSPSDYRLAKACFASIKHYYPEANISLLIDGNIKLDKVLIDQCDAVLTKDNIRDSFLRENSFGWGITKMIAFWESPYENFILLDADTILNGRCLDLTLFKAYDIVLDKPKYEYSREAIDQYFFNKDLIQSHYPEFNYFNDAYANVGIIYGKKGIIPMEDYQKFLKLYKSDKRTFPCPEQGWLNLICFNWSRSGRINFFQKELQILIPDFSKNELEENYSIGLQNRKISLLHFAGKPKPFIWSKSSLSKTLLFFRIEYQRKYAKRKYFVKFNILIEDLTNFTVFSLPKKIKRSMYNIKRQLYLTYKGVRKALVSG